MYSCKIIPIFKCKYFFFKKRKPKGFKISTVKLRSTMGNVLQVGYVWHENPTEQKIALNNSKHLLPTCIYNKKNRHPTSHYYSSGIKYKVKCFPPFPVCPLFLPYSYFLWNFQVQDSSAFDQTFERKQCVSCVLVFTRTARGCWSFAIRHSWMRKDIFGTNSPTPEKQ